MRIKTKAKKPGGRFNNLTHQKLNPHPQYVRSSVKLFCHHVNLGLAKKLTAFHFPLLSIPSTAGMVKSRSHSFLNHSLRKRSFTRPKLLAKLWALAP